MLTSDWLKTIQEKYSTSDDIRIDNYQHLLNYLRATDSDTPELMTATLLKRLLTGESALEISRILGTASKYSELLYMFNSFGADAEALKKKAADPSATDEEKAKMKAAWEVAWGKRESYWASMQILNVPLIQVCFDIENGKYLWCVDFDRIV